MQEQDRKERMERDVQSEALKGFARKGSEIFL